MLKLLGLLKKSIPAMLAILILLYIQAMCDLTLPSFISNIVNVGIQQGGVENVTPDKLRVSEMEKLTLFMSDEDKQTVNDSYTSDGNIYTINDEAKTNNIDSLNEIFSMPIVVVSGIDSGSFDLSTIGASASSEAAASGLDLYSLLKMLPEDQRAVMLGKIEEQFDAYKELGGSLIEQAGIAYVKSEYEAVGIDTDRLQINYILLAGIKMLGFSLISVFATIMVALLASRLAALFGKDMRSSIFNKVVGFSSKELNSFSSASLITRCTNDISQIQLLMVWFLRLVIYAPILGVGALFKIIDMDTGMTWIVGATLTALIVLIVTLLIVAMPKFQALQKIIDKLNLVSREILSGLSVIRAFSREKHEEARFDTTNVELMKTQLFVNRVMVVMMPVMMLIMNGVSLLIIWVGAKQIENGAMQVGNLMAFIQYTFQIVMAFMMLSMMSIMLPRAIVSANRIAEVLNTDSSINDPPQPKTFAADGRGLVEFKNVSYRYPDTDENILSDITFTAKPGETTAIVGSTGSGKTTLISLIPRFFDASSGEVLIDGLNINSVSLHDLRGKIGYVPQKGQLFTGTIKSNIGYGDKEYSDEDIRRAAEIAQASGFIEQASEQYLGPISQGGTNVSGGQRQRLSIARAIAKNPQIYIFDDSFSALDYKTDAQLRRALREATGDSTILLVAQRINTVLNADQIIVLDEGRIVGKGTHKELFESCEVYKQIALSQLSSEEVSA